MRVFCEKDDRSGAGVFLRPDVDSPRFFAISINTGIYRQVFDLEGTFTPDDLHATNKSRTSSIRKTSQAKVCEAGVFLWLGGNAQWPDWGTGLGMIGADATL